MIFLKFFHFKMYAGVYYCIVRENNKTLAQTGIGVLIGGDV